jgi:hypothetical protein
MGEIAIMSNEEAQALLAKSEDDLLAMIGSALGPAFGSASGSKRQLIEKAKLWVAENSAALRNRICPHPIVRRIMEESVSDEVAIVLGIEEILGGVTHPLVIAGVSVLIAKQGCRRFCGKAVGT